MAQDIKDTLKHYWFNSRMILYTILQ